MSDTRPPSPETYRRWVELYADIYQRSEQALSSLVVAPDGFRETFGELLGAFRRDVIVAEVESEAVSERTWSLAEAFRRRWLVSAWAVVARIDAPGSPFEETMVDRAGLRSDLMYLTEQVELALRLHPDGDWVNEGWPDLPVVSLPPMPDFGLGEALPQLVLLGLLLGGLYVVNNSKR